jgi:ABC-type glutathione transport system ATPase component/ABC-type dipeptide/oligopeptide/nickel transport system permease subunit
MVTALKRSFTTSLTTSHGRLRLAGILILAVFFLAALFAPLITPYNPSERVCASFQPPDREHWLGCNDVGHDLFTEIVYGARVSLTIGLVVAIVSTLLATLVALLAGFLGGWVDQLFMRTVDVVMAIPFLPLVIVLGVFLGAGLSTQILVISLVMWAHPARELRSQVLAIRESGYVESALAMGSSQVLVMLRHILPEITPLIVPQFVRVAHHAILIEAALSFLGLGDPVQKSWGGILFYANARAAFLTGAWTYWVLPPGLCIALVVVAFAFIGYSLGGKSGQIYYPFGSFTLKRREPASPNGDHRYRLRVDQLTTVYIASNEPLKALDDVSLGLRDQEIVGIVGESGSGKSTLAMAVLGLLKYPAAITSGRIYLGHTDLLGLTRDRLQQLRGKRLAFIPQSAMNTLNPVMTILTQVQEAILLHTRISRKDAAARAQDLLRLVELPEQRIHAYPHELSGGMRQRVVTAIALANEPEVIIADEPTTGLDVLVQTEIIRLLIDLQQRLGISVVFITHDVPLISSVADRIAVMYQGRIVDSGAPLQLAQAAGHAHTRALFENFPRLQAPKRWQRTPGSGYEPAPLLHLAGVSRTFRSRRRLDFKPVDPVRAVKDVSFTIGTGEVVGLIGGSGSGKTTLARLIMGLIPVDNGDIFFDGQLVTDLARAERRAMLKDVQMVFQDPYQSMRSGMRVRDAVAEPLRIHGVHDDAEITGRVAAALGEVQLPQSRQFLHRRIAELSGGQRQRVAFARAVITNPRLIIADEPTSMLDVSLRMGLLELMESLRTRRNVGYLFITHDLALARHFCDRLIVLQHGNVVEVGLTEQVISQPAHAYTRALVAAVVEPGFAESPTSRG